MTAATTTDKTAATDEFAKLLGELDVLAKATPKGDDKKIVAAAEDGKDPADSDDDDDDDDVDGKKGGKKGAPMTKSLTVTLEDGTIVEAEDGTELIKALSTKLDESVAVGAKTKGEMLKGLTAAVAIIKDQGDLLKSQGATIAELQAQVTKLAGEGRGRKTVVTLNERTTATDSLQKGGDGINLNDFMLKATEKFQEGKLTGMELSILEAAANRGIQPSQEFVRKVIG
jgi:hypothetical protein